MEMNRWVVFIESSLSFNQRGITDKEEVLGHQVHGLPAWALPPTKAYFRFFVHSTFRVLPTSSDHGCVTWQRLL